MLTEVATPSVKPQYPAWAEQALLLVAHGTQRYADTGRAVLAHAATLRAEGCFAEVAVGFLNGSPTVAEALASLAASAVHVVPFFMEQGWFVREAVPRALSDVPGRRLHYHPPVGTHPDLPALAARRVQRAAGADAARFAVLLVGHGSARSPGRPLALHRHADAVAATGKFAQVRAAFLEEPPFVADALRDWRTLPVAVLGFFAGDGGHVREDLPTVLAAEHAQRGASGGPVLDLGTIGDDPEMPRIILEQAAIPP
ncbi:MAG TPA: CbiX/SirB N-terminal domain-containing protein [Acetobacteraceae bacterium]|nr:CbiX/SirB N-terminal domain-containing protein [Acetobacteraceae bacterium]